MQNPEYLTRKAAGEYLKSKFGFGTERVLAKDACLGGGPPFHKMGAKALYRPADLDSWAKAKIGPAQASTSDTVAA